MPELESRSETIGRRLVPLLTNGKIDPWFTHDLVRGSVSRSGWELCSAESLTRWADSLGEEVSAATDTADSVICVGVRTLECSIEQTFMENVLRIKCVLLPCLLYLT